jgi:NAD-dependent dihydropyrimidine dehydrogenase PreA subunit
MTPLLTYRQVRVGGKTLGTVGQPELFAALHQQGQPPDATATGYLLDGVRRHNYIPPAAAAETAEALLRKYSRFCEQQSTGCACASTYGTWRGQPRETIPWYPTLREDLCDGCGACLRFCTFGVFAAGDDSFGSAQDKRRVEVAEPYRCQVGCSACVAVCGPGALVFPPRGMLEAYGGG